MQKTISYIQIPAESVPIKEQADLCVIGGSCTGVFAAVRAARLGAKVVLIEQVNRFGGVASLDFVGIWHSIYDLEGTRQIIGGLSWEMLDRMEHHQGAAPFRSPSDYRGCGGNPFNTDELTLELDDLVVSEPNIRIYFHTVYTGVIMSESGDRIEAVTVYNKSGKFAIQAKRFVDASGDGVLCRDAGVPMRRADAPQSPTSCCRLENFDRLCDPIRNYYPDFADLTEKYRDQFPNLPCGYAWGTKAPGSSVHMLAGTRVLNCDCSDADEITRAELESRRQIRAVTDMYRKEFPNAGLVLQGLPAAIGIREGLHMESMEQVRGDDMLHSRCDPEMTIGCGTYPVDIHCNTDNRIEFFNLDGNHRIYRASTLIQADRWLPDGEILSFYRIPMKCMIPKKITNLIAAGRMLDADAKAFGALRVMINLNQCGEAAGVAAFLSLDSDEPIQNTNVSQVRKTLGKGGSILV